MKRVAWVSMALCGQKVGGRKSREKLVPQRTGNGWPPALASPLQRMSFSSHCRVWCRFHFRRGLFVFTSYPLLEDWSLTCESVLAPDHQFLQGDRFSGEVRAYLLSSKRFLLNPSCMGNMDPGKKPQEGGLTACWLVLLCSGCLCKRRRVCPLTAEFCHHLPSAPPSRDCKPQGGSGGQSPPRCWTLLFPPPDHLADLA